MTGGELFLGQSAFEWLSTYGYYILPLLVMTLGPIAGFAGGFMASLGALNPFIVFGIWYITIVITDTMFFALGRFGKKFLGRFTWTQRLVSKIEEGSESSWMRRMKDHYIKLFIFLKISPTVTITDMLALVAGFVGISYHRQITASLIGQVFWSGIFVAGGYYFGGSFEDTGKLIKFILIVLGGCALVYLMYIRFLHSFVIKKFGETLAVLRGMRKKR